MAKLPPWMMPQIPLGGRAYPRNEVFSRSVISF